MCGITCQLSVHPTWKKKENNSAEKGGFFLFLFPLPLARNKWKEGKWKHLTLEFWKVVYHALWYRFILCRLRGKDSYRRGRILKHCLRWTYKNQEIFCRKNPLLSHLSLIWRNSDNGNPQNFQTALSSDFYFSNL